MKINEVKINESLSLLEDFNPSVINELKKSYPHLSKVFKGGIMLGAEEEISKKIANNSSNGNLSSWNETKNQEAELRLKIAMSSLEVIVSKCDSFIPNLKKKLKRLNAIQLVSQLVIAISGASLLTILSTEISKSVNYLIGALTLTGSLLTIYIQSKSTSITPNSKSIFKIYEDLVNLHLNAEQKLSELKIYNTLSNGLSNKRLPKLIESSTELCLEVRKLMRII